VPPLLLLLQSLLLQSLLLQSLQHQKLLLLLLLLSIHVKAPMEGSQTHAIPGVGKGHYPGCCNPSGVLQLRPVGTGISKRDIPMSTSSC
jgi:hypothetical protein